MKFHLDPVIRVSKELSMQMDAIEDIVEIAAIFHDYADLLDYNNREEHHIISAKLTYNILKKDGFLDCFVNKVCACILNHRGNVRNNKMTNEEICVCDADAISHLENVIELVCWRMYCGDSIIEANDFVV